MKKAKQILALTAVVLWGILLAATLACALIQTETARTLFKGLILTDIGLPVVIYAMMLVYKYLTRRS